MAQCIVSYRKHLLLNCLVMMLKLHASYELCLTCLQTRLAGDLGITDANAALLPGILAISESIGKIASGKIISYRRSIVLHVYQASWTGMSLCSFLCPLAEGFLGLAFYAVGWGFFLGNANGGCVAFINQLVGNKMLVRAYSIFLLCLSPAALAGPPIAGECLTTWNHSSV